MSQLQIIGLKQSNYVWATRIACAEKGVPHEHIDLGPHSPDVDGIHPLGKIPVMRHGDFVLCESRAICGYIDRTFDGPKLVPEDSREAAIAEQWTSIITTSIEPIAIRQYLFGYMFPATPDGSPNRVNIDAAIPKLSAGLRMVEGAVQAGHLGGANFRLADAYLVPILFYLRTTPEGGQLIANSSALTDYFERNVGRKSVADTMPS